MRLKELRNRIPQLTDHELREAPQGLAEYLRLLDRALHEHVKIDHAALIELNANPVLLARRVGSAQSLSLNTSTLVQFNEATIDTHGWWANYAYTPQEAGFYRCSWSLDFHDATAIAASTYATVTLNGPMPCLGLGYGNGAALDIPVAGSVMVECNGATDALSLSALILTGTAPKIWVDTPCRAWFAVDYIGRRKVPQ